MGVALSYAKLTIIGSGPAGYTAALYAARANLKPRLITGFAEGGQLMTTTDVDNWPADPFGVQGPDLMRRFRDHAARFGSELITDEIVSVDLKARPFVMRSTKQIYTSDAIIVATGASAMYLGLVSEQRYLGHGVSGCATCDGFFYKDEAVCVVGGGNTAIEEALYLSHIAKHVTLVHRRDQFRAEAILVDKLIEAEKSGRVTILRDSIVEEIVGDGKEVTGVRIRNVKNSEIKVLILRGVFIAIGHRPNTAIFHEQLELRSNGYLRTRGGADSGSTATSVLGVFAAGDVQDHVYRQAITSAASGCMAAIDAEKYLSLSKTA
jgi:thioredoxin reductase (NADPH)